MDYDKLLKKAREKLPDSVLKKERFEVPKIMGHLQGNKTVLSNFSQIATHLNRDPDWMLKYILKELATPGEMQKNLVVLGRKVSASNINEKISEFARKYVICKECGKPDTKISRQNRIIFLKCNACGARYPAI
ncbi:Translation initiation factor 2 subunit beta [archaeon GW2011_AR15]|nr:Translation initiation factor 2 subunit beta [archaeon GW2011_AR15]MBS3103900.1 translation initiation factor IF-2 subunit beta [Candidatus Woesearchaeota archaeon]